MAALEAIELEQERECSDIQSQKYLYVRFEVSVMVRCSL